MDKYVQRLKWYVMNLPEHYRYDDAGSLLDMLCYFYIENNPIEGAVIRCKFADLDEILSKLTLRENDEVFRLVCDLCTEHERRAFQDGIRLGIRLICELTDTH